MQYVVDNINNKLFHYSIGNDITKHQLTIIITFILVV